MMNKIFIFSLGVTIGSLVTWKIVEEKYKRIADEEIESVIERFKNRKEQTENENEDDYAELVDDLGYSVATEYEPYASKVELVEPMDQVEPYIIAPEEYGDDDKYAKKSWVQYADLVLADEDDDIVSDPEAIIGDALEHFGEYEDDSVYVRNENVKWDIEILKSEKLFGEITNEEGN